MGLRDHVTREDGWSGDFRGDEDGLVTLGLPGPGRYEVMLAERPGENWQATTRTVLTVQVTVDGDVLLLPADGEALPLGSADGVAFAFGLVVVRQASLWLALTAAMLLSVRAVQRIVSRKAAAVRAMERAVLDHSP